MSDDHAQELERLEALHARGALTAEEYAAARARLLAEQPAPPSEIRDDSPPPAELPATPSVFPPPREKPLRESPAATSEPPVAAASIEDATAASPQSETTPWGDTIASPEDARRWDESPANVPPPDGFGAVEPTPRSSPLPPPPGPYPVTYDVAYPERLSRWKTLLRLPLLVPVWMFMYLLQPVLWGLLTIGWTTVFFKKKYPSWAFAGAGGAMGFTARAIAYGLLQTDRFPSFDRESSPVLLEFDPPPSGQLSRWRVFWWKLALLVPHFVVLGILNLALFVVTILAWFGIIFSGHYPRGMFPFATGVMRWHFRVTSYFASFNDRYPPYSLSAEAGPAGKGATLWSGIGGLALAGGFVTLITVGIIVGSRPDVVHADYASLKQGRPTSTVYYGTSNGREVGISLQRATDPGDDLARVLVPASNERLVVFEWRIANLSDMSRNIPADATWLKAETDGKNHDYDPQILTVEGRVAPGDIESGDRATVRAVFVIPKTATPVELHFKAGFTGLASVKYEFE